MATQAFIERTRKPSLPAATLPLRPNPRRADIDIMAVAQVERCLNTAPLSALLIERDELGRWLALPGAELWAEQHAEKSARIRVLWQTIQRRFPEYAAKQGVGR